MESPVVAALTLDTRTCGPGRGMRSGHGLQDRLLYEAEFAFVELLLPRATGADRRGECIVGHVLPRGQAADDDLSSYRLEIEEEDGRAHNVWADAEGGFVLPVSGASTFRVQCIPPQGEPCVLAYQSRRPQ